MSKSQRSPKNKLIWLIPLILSGVYLLNLTAGIDILPDNFPIIGNLDEVALTALFLKSIEEIRK